MVNLVDESMEVGRRRGPEGRFSRLYLDQERDHCQDDEYDHEPLGNTHAHAGHSTGAEDCCHDSENQEQYREANKVPAELEGD